MNNHDDFEVSMESYKSMIKDAPDGGWDEFPFDQKFWWLVAPMKVGPSFIGHVDEICGEGGKLTSAKITRAEAKVLSEYYLKELDDIYRCEELQGGTGSDWARKRVYANKRIRDFIDAGAISEKRVNELGDSIFGDSN